MIRFGPAGIPLSCKGRTLKDGIEDIHNLSLTALEIQLVRTGTYEICPEDEDIGIPFKDVDGHFVVEIIRCGEVISDPRTVVEENDVLIGMDIGIAPNFCSLYELGSMAKRLDINLSIHTPNYMDLGSNSELTDIGMDTIRRSGLVIDALGGDIVTTNLGLYTLDDDDETENNIRNNISEIVDWWRDMKLRPKLGIEITGHQDIFGSLEQVCSLCDDFDGLVPVVNWPNYHSRSRDNNIDNMVMSDSDDYLLEAEDFKNVIDDIAPYYNGKNIHTIFSGIEHTEDNSYRLTPIKKGDLRFDTFAECLVDLRPNMTIISSSPLLEHDAMYMRIIYERAFSRRVSRELRIKRKEEIEAELMASSIMDGKLDKRSG
ncbi:MAG: TIM barrel protein [archaeon]|nr:TIM barrel protein [archaeon]